MAIFESQHVKYGLGTHHTRNPPPQKDQPPARWTVDEFRGFMCWVQSTGYPCRHNQGVLRKWICMSGHPPPDLRPLTPRGNYVADQLQMPTKELRGLQRQH